MELVYVDDAIVVCIKPSGVRSTDEPGGVPELVRLELGNPKADVRTVHRLDQVVSGLMVLARTEKAASELSRQIRENEFEKEYLAVVHGIPPKEGTLRDLLYRDKARRMTMVASEMAKGVQEAVLDYQVQNAAEEISRVRIRLHTGRTHQIRVHLSSIGHPLLGDTLYGGDKTPFEAKHSRLIQGQCLVATELRLTHPSTGEDMRFSIPLPEEFEEIMRILRKEFGY